MRKMVKSILVVGAVLGLAMSASAVSSLVVTASSLTYNPGETITLTVSGGSDGATSVDLSASIASDQGALSNVSVEDLTGRNTVSTFTYFANTAAAGGCAPTCLAADAFEYVGFAGIPIDLTFGQLSVWNLDTTGASGDIVIDLAPAAPAGFFGADAAQITLTQIPEPTTGVLMGFGLMGLAIAGRRKN